MTPPKPKRIFNAETIGADLILREIEGKGSKLPNVPRVVQETVAELLDESPELFAEAAAQIQISREQET